MALADDLQRVLEMAYNRYQRRLAKDPERLREVSTALAPYGVALSDFNKFRLGYSDAAADTLSGYYREHLARYPALFQRFEQMGLLSAGGDALAGCATFPMLDECRHPEGLVGVVIGGEGEPRQMLPPGQEAEGWLFGLDRATYGLRDHGVAIVAGSVLSFFTLYSILAAIGLEVAVGLATPRLSPEALSRLIALGAEEVYLLAADQDEAGLRDSLAALPGGAGLTLTVLPSVAGPADAEACLEEVAALTEVRQVRWMLRQAVEARRHFDARAAQDQEL